MRLRKADLRRRVNGSAVLRFSRQGLTSYAGLELLRQYLSTLDLSRRIRRCVGRRCPGTDYGGVSMVLVLVSLLVLGGRRIRHLGYMSTDPIVERFCGVRRLPSPRSVNRWLSRCDEKTVDGLLLLNDEIVAARIRECGLHRLTLDVDGSVVSTGLQVEGARRGFNPHQRKKPSYYPITAYEAQSGQIVGLKNRPGNVHDGKASVEFLEDLISRLREHVGGKLKLEFRMDGAFFLQNVLDLLERERAEYAIKVPFWPWLGIKERIAARRRWRRVDDQTSYFETTLRATSWDRCFRVVILRKRVRHETRKNYQLDLFDPSTGHFEYSAIATNKRLKAPALRAFINGRGIHEKVYGELKNDFAFDSLPSQRYAANSTWQALSVLAFNLTRGFQASTTARARNTNRKRRTRHLFESIQTLRYKCFHRAGLLLQPDGRSTLDVGTAPAIIERFSTVARSLRKAA